MYLGKPPWDTGLPAPELMKYILENPPGRALDLGCGTGTNLLALLEKDWRADGVDIALISVLKARRKIRKYMQNGKVILGSVLKLDFSDYDYNLILDIGCFHSLSKNEWELYWEKIAGRLEADGVLMMYAFLHQPNRKQRIDLTDTNQAEKFLFLESRVDGTERGVHPSTWLTFRKKNIKR